MVKNKSHPTSRKHCFLWVLTVFVVLSSVTSLVSLLQVPKASAITAEQATYCVEHFKKDTVIKTGSRDDTNGNFEKYSCSEICKTTTGKTSTVISSCDTNAPTDTVGSAKEGALTNGYSKVAISLICKNQ